MKKLLPIFLLAILLLESCKVYDSKSATKEDALLFGGKVRVKSDSNSSYKFEKLIVEDNQLYGIGKRESKKSKASYTKNIVNENKLDKNVKILLTDDLVNEIHLYNKGKSTALNVIGIGAGSLLILLALASAVAIVLLLSGG